MIFVDFKQSGTFVHAVCDQAMGFKFEIYLD